MKKILLTGLIGFILFTDIAFAQTQICGIGVNIVKDPYNKKVFVFKILPDSVASKYNLPEGAEILEIDGKKVKNLDINQISNLIRGEEGSIVNLLVKYNNRDEIYSIARAKFILPENKETKFDTHWKQVVPINKRIEPIPQNILNSMSKKWYSEVVPFTNYWLNRKAEFTNGYNACMTYSEAEQNVCLINLTNREINKTAHDEQLEVQENMLRQQTIQNSLNAVNQIQ